MICNYHAHTYRCRHAEGTEREYIERAVAHGIKKMGFSDHIPFVFPDGFRSDYRVPPEQVEDYFATLRALREEYRDRIEIKIGFEMEYYPAYFDEMYENARRWGAEYLILGQHFTHNEHPNGFYCGWQTARECDLEEYVKEATLGIESGVFTYIAHPDIINFVGDREVYLRHMKRLCEAAKACSVPLEINMLGIRGHRCYPAPDFWRIAGETGCRAVLGFDAHTVHDAYDDASIPAALALAEASGVEIIEDPTLVPLVAR